MKVFALSALLIAFVPAVTTAAADDDFRFSASLERGFTPGGMVRLDLSAGEYRVRKGDDNRVRLVWHTRTPGQMDEVRVRADVRGSEASIWTSGPRRSFRVEIELPGRSDLFVRMTAGALRIAGIEGNKDVRLRAGELHVEVADADRYGHVDASVTAGDLFARMFGVSTGGLWRSFRHEGRGPYTLRARLWAGDLRLLPARTDEPVR